MTGWTVLRPHILLSKLAHSAFALFFEFLKFRSLKASTTVTKTHFDHQNHQEEPIRLQSPPTKMAPLRHLRLTLPRPSLSSYTGSTSSSSSSPLPPVLDCDVPVPSVEHVDAANRTAAWIANINPGTPALSENPAPARASSVSRGRSLSDHGIPRSSPSATPIRTVSPSDGERETKREASEDSIWSASPQLRARQLPVSAPGEPAPLSSPSAAPGPRVLGSTRSGSKRSRDVEDVGAGERSSQRRRRSTSPGSGPSSGRSSASRTGQGKPVPLPSASVSGRRVLGSNSSGSKRTRDTEDVGAGDRSPKSRARSGLSPGQSSAAAIAVAPLPSGSASGPRVLRSNSSGGKRTRVAEHVGATLRPGLPHNSIMEGMMEVALGPFVPSMIGGRKWRRNPADKGGIEDILVPYGITHAEYLASLDSAVKKPVVDPSVPAIDAAVTTDRAGPVDPALAAQPQSARLTVVDVVNIVDIAPAVGPAAAVTPVAIVAVAAAANPGPVPDRAETRVLARIDALFAKSRSLPRAERSRMVSPLLSQHHHRSSLTSFAVSVARVLALAGGAHPGPPGSGARLRIPRHQARVRRLFFGGRGWNSLLPRRQMSCLRFGCQVGPGFWTVACALAASSCQFRRSSAFSFAGLAGDLAVITWHGSWAASFWISVLLILGPSLGFASTADAPRCHHFARLLRSASTLSRLHDFTTSRCISGWSLLWGGVYLCGVHCGLDSGPVFCEYTRTAVFSAGVGVTSFLHVLRLPRYSLISPK